MPVDAIIIIIHSAFPLIKAEIEETGWASAKKYAIAVSKITIYGILKRTFGQGPNFETEIFIFQHPTFEFLRGSSLFQGIVAY